jgi:uncharacterized repeat protein (TIGR04076 family)
MGFMGDEERFPCHFNYKIGDYFIFDGEKFTGRICPGLFATGMPVISALHRSGNAHPNHITFRYSGLSKRDESMKQYDGMGFRPLKSAPAGALPQHLKALSVLPGSGPENGWGFVCGDSRTSAFFFGEAFDLADVGDSTPYYRREMAILDKIRAEPGLTAKEIVSRFTGFEREEIYPPLTPFNTQLFMEELASTNYIELRGGKAFSKNK